MKASYCIPKENLQAFMKGAAMNNQYGIQFFALAEPEAAARVLPPPLELPDPKNPVLYGYVVNIREPSFAPWYMEGGIGLMARFGKTEGLYFLGLMLSGPGALMGAFTGRESSGLPKKLCERIRVDRLDNEAHCCIERHGVRLLDVKLRMGQYNDPAFRTEQEGCAPDKPITIYGNCLLHTYQLGQKGFYDMHLLQYDSATRFYQWEPAEAEISLASSPDDPWASVPIRSILGGGFMVSDNWVRSLSGLYQYPDEDIPDAMQRLFLGRYDQCTLLKNHQWYE